MRVGSLVKHIPNYYGLGVVVRKRPYGGWTVRFPNANNKIIGLTDTSLEVICE